MTAYNRAEYIDEAIESVLAQSYTDFELVIVDDGSTDDTVARARAHAARDPRVRVEINPRNLGDYPNRNRAAALARGRLLKYHDSDDVMYPHCLETMVSALESAPSAGLALSCGVYWFGAPSPMLLTPRLAFQREFLGSRLFMCGPGGSLMRAEMFRQLGGFDNVGSPSDYVFWLKACARFPVVLTQADLFWYRTHAGQILTRPSTVMETARASGRAWAALNAPECPLDGADLQTARRNHAWDVAREIVRSLRRGQAGLAWYRLRHAGLSAGEWLRYLRLPTRDPYAGTPRNDGRRAHPALLPPAS
jgi:glycosyltransferase involved in cell wall biosynthesis